MIIKLNKVEVLILLGCRLTFLGRPFHNIMKKNLQPADENRINELHEEMLAARQLLEKYQSIVLNFSEYDLRLLHNIVSSCIIEIGNDPIDLRLHLNSSSLEQVTLLRDKIASIITIES